MSLVQDPPSVAALRARDLEPSGSYGALLKEWRRRRGLSQQALGLAANVSQRHVSFLESGRANPSRSMVLTLARILDAPLRDRNVMLRAAGFREGYAERDLSHASMAPVRRAVDFMLAQQEPYPAFCLDALWNLKSVNLAGMAMVERMVPMERLAQHYKGREINLAEATLDPEGLAPFIVNLEEAVGMMLHRVRREALVGVNQRAAQALGDRLAALYPGLDTVPEPAGDAPVLSVILEVEGERWSWFSILASLGTPLDVTAQELQVELFFPGDEATERLARDRLTQA